MSSNSNSDAMATASPNFSGQEPFSQLHVTAIEEPGSPSPPYPSSHTPPHSSSVSSPRYDEPARYSTLEAAEKGYFTTTAASVPYAGVQGGIAEGGPDNTGSTRKRWSRKKFIIVVGVVAAIVIGAVLGGVLGGVLPNRSNNGSSSESSSPSSTDEPPPTPTVAPIMAGTATPDAIYTYPTAVSWGAPHLEVFSLTNEGGLVWKYIPANSSTDGDDAAWAQGDTSFTTVGAATGPYQHSPVVFTRGGRYTNMYLASGEVSGEIYEKEHDSDMEWTPGGNDDAYIVRAEEISSPPGIATWIENEMVFFVIGNGDNGWSLWYRYWNTNNTVGSGLSTGRDEDWSEWENLRGSWASYMPTALSWGSRRMDVFVVGREDNTLYQQYWSDTGFQGSFASLGGHCTSRPVAVNATRGRLDVFVRGGDAGLWWLPFDGGDAGTWGNWTGISHGLNGTGPSIRGEPAAIVHDDTISVFAWSDDNRLLHRQLAWKENVWEPADGMAEIADDLVGPPSTMSYIPGQLEIFAHVLDDQLGHKSWNYESDTWTPADGWELLGRIQ